MSEPPWRKYEAAAQAVLESVGTHFGISTVEGKQSLSGKSGTTWEIDAKALLANGQGFLVVEVRRHTTKALSQESLGALAFRIGDVGASGGVVVSPLPLQSGAAIVAMSEGIEHLRLTQDSTATDYLAEYMGMRFLGASMNSTAIATSYMDAEIIRGPGLT